MSERDTAESIVRTIWREIDKASTDAVRAVRGDAPETFQNPFTGEQAERPWAPEAVRFREELLRCGADADEALAESLRVLLRSTACAAAFHTLSAAGGSGVMEDDARVSVQDEQGNEITYLHEILHQADPEKG